MQFEENDLEKLNTFRMPFGKYQNFPLIELPEPYVVWFYDKGLPQGELGRLMGLLYEIKLNGLEDLVYKLREFK